MSNIILNNEDINNNIIRINGTQACAACKYQRRKCAPDCLLAPYFPHHLHHQFLNAHRLFGVSNITKIIKPLPQPQKDQAMRTIKFESDIRASDPVGGSCRIIRNLQTQIELACAEHELVLQQLTICRAAADSVSLVCEGMCDPDPQTQPQNVGAESEGVINNGVEDHESNAYSIVDEAVLPIHQQTQPQNVGVEFEGVINNGGKDCECNAYNVVDEAKSPVHQQTQPQSQTEDDPNNHEGHLYQHDHRYLDENNDKGEVGIEEYLLHEDNGINDENSNVILSFQDIEASWAMQDALAYCLHGKEGYSNENKDFNADNVDIGVKRPRLGHCNDGPHLFQHSEEEIPKNKKARVQEETTSCICNDEKSISKEAFVTIEDDESIRTAATMYTTA